MDLESDFSRDDRLESDRGRFIRAASKIMNEDADEDVEALESLDSFECAKCRKCPHCNSNTKSLTNTIRLTMLEINEIKERHRERRHREFIQLLEKYLGGDKLKSPDALRNIKLEDTSVNNANNDRVRIPDESPQISRNNKESSAMAQPHTTRKRLLDSNHVGVPPKKQINQQNNNSTDTLRNNNDAKQAKTYNQRNELVAMRQKMLDMQRRKMEDRERKKRENKIP